MFQKQKGVYLRHESLRQAQKHLSLLTVVSLTSQLAMCIMHQKDKQVDKQCTFSQYYSMGLGIMNGRSILNPLSSLHKHHVTSILWNVHTYIDDVETCREGRFDEQIRQISIWQGNVCAIKFQPFFLFKTLIRISYDNYK